MKFPRASGVLLHVTSLPSEFGIGDLGPCSRRFVTLLHVAKQRFWSILPLTSTSLKYGCSPYQPTSAFAGNTLLISPEALFQEGLLAKGLLEKLKVSSAPANFRTVEAKKEVMLKNVYLNFKAASANEKEFEAFRVHNAGWLDDYALYKTLDSKAAQPWHEWPRSLRNREPQALADKTDDYKAIIECEKFAQFLFFRQWQSLKTFCRSKGVNILGDVPFYVSYNSADAWAHPELFRLNDHCKPVFVGGVPPDYFSKTGQLWGNPVYNWRAAELSGFQWWIERIRHSLELCDALRLDHFRGFTAFWRVPASAKTAKKGKWTHAPARRFFSSLKREFPNLPFVAEDLGLITPSVKRNLKCLGVTGTRVLIFAFGGSERNSNLPCNYPENVVTFTSTHDTNTVKGWFVKEASSKQKKAVFKLVGREVDEEDVSWAFIKQTEASKAALCIVPVQDLLSLGSSSRMNRPAEAKGNWVWRLLPEQLDETCFRRLGEISESFGR